MRIAIIADPLDKQSAGIYEFTRNLLEKLPKVSKTHDFCFFRFKVDSSLSVHQEEVKNPIGILNKDPLRIFIKLPQAIKKWNPDLVIEPAHFGPFNLPKHIKRVTVIHDLTPIKFPGLHRFHSQLLQRLFLPGILKRADLIVCNSKNTLNDVLEYSPQAQGKIEFVHLGKDDSFKPKIDPGVLFKYGIGESFFLFVGTIEPRKNLNKLLSAYEDFKTKTSSPHQLVIVGAKGWKSKSFYRQLQASPFRKDIVLPGYVPAEDLPVFYSMATAFIYPSLYEGFGLPVLEAMACGAAVITSNTSSIPEVGGDAVLYVNPNSVNELSQQMQLINEDNNCRTQLKEKALAQANQFSWERFTREFINLLEEKFDR